MDTGLERADAESTAPEAAASADARFRAEQLRLVTTQLARLPLVLCAINGFIAWMLWQSGAAGVALAWLLLATAFEFWRHLVCRRLRRAPPVPAAPALQRLSLAFVAAGLLRLVPIPWLMGPDNPEQAMVYTMVCVGLAAGGVATAGGVVWAYAAWAALVGGALSLAWLLHGDAADIGAGILTALLFLTLTLFARDQARTLRKLFFLADENQRLAGSLRAERDRAEQASLSKTRFFAAASHDLRQPLHALSINATALEFATRRQGDAQVRELSRSLSRALRQSNDLLDTLLDISQLDAGVVEVRPVAVDAVALLRRLREEFAATAAERGLTLDLRLPEPERPLWVRTDPRQLQRLLVNLIGNALKFTREGGVTLALEPLSDPSRVRLAVEDTGPGIAPDERERVFEDFYQIGNPARDRSHGLGLGLSIVRRTARLLDVPLALHSEPGRGTRFELLLRAAAEPGVLASPTPASSGDDASDEPDALDLRVLAIDDEDEILAALAALLPTLGCELRGAHGLAEAEAALDAGFAPQLLLVDHRLQGETGPAVIEALRRRLGPVPALIVTGDTAPQDLRSALGSGIRVLHKPLDGHVLAAAMREVTQGAPT